MVNKTNPKKRDEEPNFLNLLLIFLSYAMEYIALDIQGLKNKLNNVLNVNKSSIFAVQFSGCSVARLSRRVWDAEVAGSNPATPTKSFLNDFN